MPDTANYLQDGCVVCAQRAVDSGFFAVRESGRFVLNLSRFLESRGERRGG